MRSIYLAVVVLITLSAFSGCAKVPMASQQESDKVKTFPTPPNGTAGLYVFRDSMFGAALKKDISVNNSCLGQSAPNVFFYKTLEGDQEHTIATESEFSDNVLMLKTQSGKNYFVRQYIKMGVFVGGANLEQVGEQEGKEAVLKLGMAINGHCNKHFAETEQKNFKQIKHKEENQTVNKEEKWESVSSF